MQYIACVDRNKIFANIVKMQGIKATLDNWAPSWKRQDLVPSKKSS